MAAFTILLAAAAASTTVAPAPGSSAQPHVIVVTGVPLKDTEQALKACLARRCPPNEDINASLAHAENLFVGGAYDAARRVTKDAISRNRGFARQFPIEVSDLYRANSRIAAHLGEGWDYEFSATEMHRTLDRTLDKKDPRLIDATIQWGDVYASMSRLELARKVYKDAERQALAAGRPDLASMARVRSAWTSQLGGDGWLARQELEKIAADRSADARVARLSALVLLARMDRQQGKTQRSADLVKEAGAFSAKDPIILFAPAVELPKRLVEGEVVLGGNGESPVIADGGSVTRLMPTDTFDDKWIDVGFWITPAGKVSEPEILRNRGETNWTKSLLRSIAGRVYAPMDGPSYRVERYSYTSRWIAMTGTRLRQRSPNPRIEYLDLTRDAPRGGTQ